MADRYDDAHSRAVPPGGLMIAGTDAPHSAFERTRSQLLLLCTYAEMEDLENAIANLKLAFKYKENMIPGEQMPDPARDSSFQRFLDNQEFREALREIEKGT